MILKQDELPSYDESSPVSYAQLGGASLSSGAASTSNTPSIGKLHEKTSDHITVKLQSYCKNELPIFEAGSEVAGVVLIGKIQKIKSVSIQLKGRSESGQVVSNGSTTHVVRERWVVVNDEKELWSTKNGEDLPEESRQLPFSFRLPTSGTYVRLNDRNKVTADQVPYEMLPPSCSMERDLQRIKYHLKVQVFRHGILSHNALNFYILVSPIPPITRRSKLCVEAMSHGLPPPNPDIDPDGWTTVTDEVLVKSTFGKTIARLSAQFSTPSPAIFPSSALIPFILKLNLEEGTKDDKLIKGIKINLVRYMHATIRHCSDYKSHKTVSEGSFHKINIGERNVSQEDIDQQINFHMRDGTKNFSGEIFARTKGASSFKTPNIEVEWVIQVVLSTPGIRGNHEIRFPIEIGPNAEVFEMPEYKSDD